MRLFLFFISLIPLAVGLYFLALDTLAKHKTSTTSETVYSQTYPVHARFIEEASQLRAFKRLSTDNENLIQVSSYNAGMHLGIPLSLLWCLMFQESRLNHLSGVSAGKSITGLGQFSRSAFFEVNHHLKYYLDSPKATLMAILGSDIRPLDSDPSHTPKLTSYYFIPTAVTATALYLNNRFIQLTRIADKQNLSYSPDILWAWAALSYNKGSRSVLAIWNQIRSKDGGPGLSRALTERDSFLQYALNSRLITAALHSIWSQSLLPGYSKELLTHIESVRDCSMIPDANPSPRRESNDSYGS